MDKPIMGNFQHKEHMEWLKKLDFYQDEIKIFQNELLMVLHKHPSYLSIIEHVDEYRNILLKKLAHIDDFRHRIILHEKKLSQDQTPDAELLWDHNEVRMQLEEFSREFEEMKQNFRRFAAYND